MSIRWKIALSLIGLWFIPLAVFLIFGLDHVRTSLRNEVANNYELLAREKANAVAGVLDRRIEEAQVLASQPQIVQAVRNANAGWADKSESDIRDEIGRIDRAWLASKGATTEARRILAAGTSTFLRELRKRAPIDFGELFLTDRHGATVAMTAVLTDYYQADEGWWREGFADGKGRVFIDDRGFDLSVGAVVVGVVVPVLDGPETIGILKINFRMSHIPPIISAPYEGGKIIVSLMRSRGNVVVSSEEHEAATEKELGAMTSGKESGMSMCWDPRSRLSAGSGCRRRSTPVSWARPPPRELRGKGGEKPTGTWLSTGIAFMPSDRSRC